MSNSLTNDPEFVSGMLFFELSETSHAVINQVMAACARIAFKENRKDSPDEDLLKALTEKRNIALRAVRDSENFTSLEQMSELIHKFVPILKNLLDLEKTYW